LNFGSIGSCYVRLTNIATGEEILRYDMAEDFSTETAVQFGSLYFHNNEWKFKAIGVGYVAGLQAFLDEYNYVA
jgi:tellurium resistance protein TerD